MRKIVIAALIAVTPAWGDEPAKSAADFVLSACLPAKKDLANVDKIAQEKGWSRLPLVPPLIA